MRLDKFLTEMNICSRSQSKQHLQKGAITVNGIVCKDGKLQINENSDTVCFKGMELVYQKFFYYMLNKPSGIVSATCDNTCDTVIDLFPKELQYGLFPVGRLDKDTEGLLLITNDGELSHRLLSPKKHVDKTYYIKILYPISVEQCSLLEEGIDIGEKHMTLPAKVKIIDDLELELTIHEGKFHQVKRMLQAIDNKVLYLKRIRFGPLSLDNSLQPGEYRELTKEEIDLLKLS